MPRPSGNLVIPVVSSIGASFFFVENQQQSADVFELHLRVRQDSSISIRSVPIHASSLSIVYTLYIKICNPRAIISIFAYPPIENGIRIRENVKFCL